MEKRDIIVHNSDIFLKNGILHKIRDRILCISTKIRSEIFESAHLSRKGGRALSIVPKRSLCNLTKKSC